MAKQAAITPSRAMMNASSQRKPFFCRYRIRNTSSAVITTPSSSGTPNSRFRPMAVPITSAMSVAMMANSAAIHSGMDTKRGKASRQAWARSRPVAMARRAHSDCSTIAIRLDTSATTSSA